MRQYWNVLSIDNRTCYDAGTLREFFWDREAQHLVYLFAKQDKLLRKIPSEGKSLPVSAMQSRSSLLKLPTEILVQIFEELDMQSSLRLTLGCRELWDIGWYLLEREVRRWWRLQSWAGSRIVVLGEYCGRNELPHDLLTEAEEKWLKNGLDHGDLDHAVEMGHLNEHISLTTGPASLFDMFYFGYQKAEADGPGPYLVKHFRSEDYRQLPSTEAAIYINFFSRCLSEYHISTEIWTVRNLSAKEFVRGDYLFSAFQEDSCPFGPDIGYPGFSEVILSRACWSTNTSTAPVESMSQGPWAGHRFEICPHSDHLINSDARWKDVSAEVAAELSLNLCIAMRNKDKLERKHGQDAGVSYDINDAKVETPG